MKELSCVIKYMRFVIFYVALSASGGTLADVYRCVDSQGRVSFSDQPCAENQTQKVIDRTPTPASAATSNERSVESRGVIDPVTKSPQSLTYGLAASYCNRSIQRVRTALVGARRDAIAAHAANKLDDIDLEETQARIARLENALSTNDCRRSKGPAREFYECVNTPIHTVSYCRQAHGDPSR